MAVMEHRRSWSVELDDRRHRVDVVYRALFGWMSIEINGKQVARGWRELQTAFGGATLSCAFRRHRIEARVTQPWLRQEYSFSLRINDELQPGSDPQAEPRSLRRAALLGIVGAVVSGVLIGLLYQVLGRL